MIEIDIWDVIDLEKGLFLLSTLYVQSKYTQESNYIAEALLGMYDIEELPHGMLPLKFTTIDHYQQEDHVIRAKLLCAKYKKFIFMEAGILLYW